MRKVMYENDEIKIDNGLFFGKGVFETILVKLSCNKSYRSNAS